MMQKHPYICSSIVCGFPTAVGLCILIYLFDPLYNLVGDRAIGIVIAVSLALVGLGLGYLAFRLPPSVGLLLGILGWVSVVLMILLLPFRIP